MKFFQRDSSGGECLIAILILEGVLALMLGEPCSRIRLSGWIYVSIDHEKAGLVILGLGFPCLNYKRIDNAGPC